MELIEQIEKLNEERMTLTENITKLRDKRKETASFFKELTVALLQHKKKAKDIDLTLKKLISEKKAADKAAAEKAAAEKKPETPTEDK